MGNPQPSTKKFTNNLFFGVQFIDYTLVGVSLKYSQTLLQKSTGEPLKVAG